jgi:hypothetical protein
MPAAAPSLRGIERYRRAIRVATGLSGAALVGFHGWLLATQIADGRLTEPGLALRWLVAAALAAGLAALYRSRASHLSRKGIAIWVLAALLHGPAVAAATADPSGVLALPEAVATAVLQITATAGSLALGLWVLSWLLGASARRSTLRLAPAVPELRRRLDPRRRPFSPRPPPRH